MLYWMPYDRQTSSNMGSPAPPTALHRARGKAPSAITHAARAPTSAGIPAVPRADPTAAYPATATPYLNQTARLDTVCAVGGPRRPPPRGRALAVRALSYMPPVARRGSRSADGSKRPGMHLSAARLSRADRQAT